MVLENQHGDDEGKEVLRGEEVRGEDSNDNEHVDKALD